MANQFLDLPVPAADGVGASIDVSSLGAVKTFTLAGTLIGAVTVEYSIDNVIFVPLLTFGNPGKKTRSIAAAFMRTNVTNFRSGAANCDVGAEDTGIQVAALTAPAGDGSGPALDVSTLGTFNTVVVGGVFTGNVVVEISEDNVDFVPCFSFAPGQDGKSKEFIAQFMRVTRDSVNPSAPGLPSVDVAAANDPAATAVTSAAAIPDEAVVRGDGGGLGVQGSNLRLNNAGDLTPLVDGTLSLGTAAAKFAAVTAHQLHAHNATTSPVTTPPAARGGTVAVDFATAYPAEQEVEVVTPGSVAMGSLNKAVAGVGTCKIESGFYTGAAFVHGALYTYSGFNALIRAQYPGAVAMGAADAYDAAATILAYGYGTHASGFASGSGGLGYVSAQGPGAWAHGYAPNGRIRATGAAAWAGGYAHSGYEIYASGDAAFAFGEAVTEDVECTGSNAGQFGQGTNTLGDTFQFGNAGIRLKTTVGAPGVLQNGDVWVDGGDVFIRSGGVSKNVSNIV